MTTEATRTLPGHDVTDLGLASEGVRRIEWAEREMPVLRLIRERFERERPLDGLRIGACLHVTTETANLMRTLAAGGAQVYLAASNPLSTKDDVAAALVAEYGIATFARRGEDRDTYYAHLNAIADTHPQLTMDDGCDLVSLLHSDRPDQIKEVLAGTEETTTGVIRLKAMAADGALGFPVVAVNEAQTKHLFDNRYGTGQSTVDGILRATNILLAGRKVAIAGYGWVGRGIASRMSGMGAHVAIIEVDPVRALEALMDGFQVMTAGDAASWGELFITATGNVNVFRREHFAAMRDGAIMANSGHFDAERQAHQPRRGGPAREPGGGRRPSGGRDGHELRESGAVGRVRGSSPCRTHTSGLRRARGDRRRSRPAQARGAGDHARSDDGRAARVRLVLEARDLGRAIGPSAPPSPKSHARRTHLPTSRQFEIGIRFRRRQRDGNAFPRRAKSYEGPGWNGAAQRRIDCQP
jgi:adenosylhomocysteinase